ncbi:uncharacterized protein A1O5_03457 [Cladophialophora psammophila CBS 110553]|uniref:Extracellular membrane protein CFEM domain-containing protein n=1 Tax=Cladophialophora psammophila CBS 110553 TaxID=1182543 RepID=W9X8N8_9EURO|nr:uncharacterized protein A1O5_03457 [Cladophialophora psammophila CBS 110553]EXJ73695.1 hypothetical protein A1O5_03457 [Cladophialophora psammophila CBS 110553]
MVEMRGALLLPLWITSLAVQIGNAAAVDFDEHGLDNFFAKRQNYTCSTEGLQHICQTNTTECIDAMCASCSGYVLIANCCALASWEAMMQCLLELMSDPSELTMTVAPTSTKSSDTSTITALSSATIETGGLEACSSFQGIVGSCESLIPGFATEAFGQQASCVCYSNGTYQPDRYDGAFLGCLSYLSTASPSEYASIAPGSTILAPCKNVATTTEPQSSLSTHYIGRLTSSTSAVSPLSTMPARSTTTGPTQTPIADSNGSASLEMVS